MIATPHPSANNISVRVFIRCGGYGKVLETPRDEETTSWCDGYRVAVFRRVLPVLAATLLVACGGGDDTTSAPTTDAAATAATTAPEAASTDSNATAPPAALQFSAPLVGGGEIELGALAGRPVLLWFWAPW